MDLKLTNLLLAGSLKQVEIAIYAGTKVEFKTFNSLDGSFGIKAKKSSLKKAEINLSLLRVTMDIDSVVTSNELIIQIEFGEEVFQIGIVAEAIGLNGVAESLAKHVGMLLLNILFLTKEGKDFDIDKLNQEIVNYMSKEQKEPEEEEPLVPIKLNQQMTEDVLKKVSEVNTADSLVRTQVKFEDGSSSYYLLTEEFTSKLKKGMYLKHSSDGSLDILEQKAIN
jgi:hypothetical protein